MGTSYRDRIAWQKAMLLVQEVYTISQSFPKSELYGLTSQLRRATVSVPSNIAEGQARWSRREFRQFLSQARGSCAEVETQLLIAVDLNYTALEKISVAMQLALETGKLINGLINSLDERAEEQ